MNVLLNKTKTNRWLSAAVRLLCFGILALSASCSGSDSKKAPEALARVDTAHLYMTEVLANLPGGLSAEDSARFVMAYVNNWIDAHLVTDVAASEVDMDQIDRLTEQYRRELIMRHYARKMFETHAAAIPEDSLKAYYEEHKSDFLLERPLVKGVYVKVPQDAPNLKTIRRIYNSDKDADIDRLEKEVLKAAIHYDYFRDRWVDWEQIETRIPADFGENPAKWPAKNKNIENTSGGYTYLLHIIEVLPAGSTTPYENARPEIYRRMIAPARRVYDANLMYEMREDAKKSGRLEMQNL